MLFEMNISVFVIFLCVEGHLSKLSSWRQFIILSHSSVDWLGPSRLLTESAMWLRGVVWRLSWAGHQRQVAVASAGLATTPRSCLGDIHEFSTWPVWLPQKMAVSRSLTIYVVADSPSECFKKPSQKLQGYLWPSLRNRTISSMYPIFYTRSD